MAQARTRRLGRTAGPGRTQRQGTSGTNRPVRVLLLVGTKKGAFVFRSDGNRKSWKQDGPFFLGNEVNHLVLDSRDNRTMLMAARTGHLGPTVFRSTNSGRTWREARRPPAFPKVADGPDAKVVERTFWLSPGHPSQPGTWYAGTSPHGLFRSDDGGVSWEPVSGFNEYVEALKKRKGYIGATPGGPLTHSILVDPRGPDHLYVGLSTGGFFESLDGGATWIGALRGFPRDGCCRSHGEERRRFHPLSARLLGVDRRIHCEPDRSGRQGEVDRHRAGHQPWPDAHHLRTRSRVGERREGEVPRPRATDPDLSEGPPRFGRGRLTFP